MDLVTSGPEARVALRDTAVVVRELTIHSPTQRVGGGLLRHTKADRYFAPGRANGTTPRAASALMPGCATPVAGQHPAERLLQQFAERFQTREWPGERLPTVYYDQRSLELDAAKRASLHAKCVVVDRQTAFVSSANFTEAAQVRNIEVGVLIRNPAIAESLNRHFEALIEAGVLRGLRQERHPDSA
ncbi:MAG: hypothetical protein IPL59_18560 [Candidatus Competibacteraceae bacterium]|nr:hypothetical protein [Candidatus Competibacteraceae bacterium]